MVDKLVDSEFFQGFKAFSPNARFPPTPLNHTAAYCQGWASAERNYLSFREEKPVSGSALSRLRPYGSHKG